MTFKVITNLYPKSSQNRVHGNDVSVQVSRTAFLKAAFRYFGLLQILFLGLFCYIFGSLFQQNSHVHNIKIVYVDYDRDIVGSSVRDAWSALQGLGFPSIIEATTAEYGTPADIRDAVCKAKFWGALYVSPGATDRLENALTGGEAASSYNRSDVIAFIWNEARYSATADSVVQANLQTVASSARLVYVAKNGTGALQKIHPTDSDALSVFTNPWQLTDDNVKVTVQGSRLIYNTLVVILIMIQDFFYLGTINALYNQFKIYSRLYAHRIILWRNFLSLSYTFVGSLCTTSAIWAFKAGWAVDGHQFALTWATLWLLAHVNFLWLDILSIWVPLPYVPMAVITWIAFNVTSILLPFELSPAFYRWAYVMPAHEAYTTLTDIWSGGCNPKLNITLPILFSEEIVGLLLGAVGVYRRCHLAVVGEEAQENAFRKRLDDAMVYEKKRDDERKAAAPIVEGDVAGQQRMEEHDREELGAAMQHEDNLMEKEYTKANQAYECGPSFGVPYRDRDVKE